MGIDRRKFLKLAGLSALGLVSQRPIELVAQEELPPPVKSGEPYTAKRWAMVIDLRKCAEHENCTDCIQACHRIHNVPDFGNPKDEVKWIWKEKYENVFPSHEHEFKKKAYWKNRFLYSATTAITPHV